MMKQIVSASKAGLLPQVKSFSYCPKLANDVSNVSQSFSDSEVSKVEMVATEGEEEPSFQQMPMACDDIKAAQLSMLNRFTNTLKKRIEQTIGGENSSMPDATTAAGTKLKNDTQLKFIS